MTFQHVTKSVELDEESLSQASSSNSEPTSRASMTDMFRTDFASENLSSVQLVWGRTFLVALILVGVCILAILLLLCRLYEAPLVTASYNSSRLGAHPENKGPRSRILATIQELGSVPIRSDANGTLTQWTVRSAVPTINKRPLKSSHVARFQLALIGPINTAALGSNAFAGSHYVVFPISKSKTLFHSKYGSLNYYKSVVTWFCDLPHADATYWHDPANAVTGSTDVCLEFQIWNDTARVQTFKSCHNPSVLPSERNPRNLVFCPNKPPYVRKGMEEFSAWHSLVPNILYHVRHGVDQIVVHSLKRDVDKMLRLMEPFEHKVSIIVIDYGARSASITNWYKVLDEGENFLINDCLNRFRGRARIVKIAHDWDEFNYAPSWRDLGSRWSTDLAATSLFEHLHPFLEDVRNDTGNVAFYEAKWFKWEKPFNISQRLITYSQKRTKRYAPNYGKSFVVPEKVAVVWTHIPTNCFGVVCQSWRPKEDTLWNSSQYKAFHPDFDEASKAYTEYAHFRSLPNLDKTNVPLDPNQVFVKDDFFLSENVELEKALRVMKYDEWNPSKDLRPNL